MKHYSVGLFSITDRCKWITCRRVEGENPPQTDRCGFCRRWDTFSVVESGNFDYMRHYSLPLGDPSGFDKILWRRTWCGFDFGKSRQTFSWGHNYEVVEIWRWWSIPYWSIIIPLTLLSAYLLLSKPRPGKPLDETHARLMREFFRGWRRKIGVLTLVMALALWCLWIRSSQCFDSVLLLNGEKSYHSIWCCHGEIAWTLVPCTKGTIPDVIRKYYGWHTTPISQLITRKNGFPPYDQFFIHLESSPPNFNNVYTVEANPNLILPFWPIGIFLTLLSAYLLLSKPRVAKPK